MRVISGEHEGAECVPHEYADDWIIGIAPDGHLVVACPACVELSGPDEVAWFTDPMRVDPVRAGGFWLEYRLGGDGRFHRLPVAGRDRGADTTGAASPDRGRVVRPAHAVAAEPGGPPGGDAPADAVGPPFDRDSAEADMLLAVHSGSVIYSPRAGRSGWQSAFHAVGFQYLGLAPGAAWTEVEQAALDAVSGLGLVTVRHGVHWVFTPAGRDLFWRWYPTQGS